MDVAQWVQELSPGRSSGDLSPLRGETPPQNAYIFISAPE